MKLNELIARYLSSAINVVINLNLAGLCLAALLITESEWVRYWLFFCAGIQVGFAGMWLFHERMQQIARAKMREEMNKIGAEYVQRISEIAASSPNPFMEFPPSRDEPPRLH